MDLTIAPCESTAPARSETTTTGAAITATGQMVEARRRNHLRVVPEPIAAAVTVSEAADSTGSERGLASVTYLPTFFQIEEEHDGDVEPDGPSREEDFASPVAAVLPVPSL